MGKKNSQDHVGGEGRREAAGAPPEVAVAVAFLVAAVAALTYAGRMLLGVDPVPLVTGLGLFLALVGWGAGGGLGDARRFEHRAAVQGMAWAVVLVVAFGPAFVTPPGATGTAAAPAKAPEPYRPPADALLGHGPTAAAMPAASAPGESADPLAAERAERQQEMLGMLSQLQAQPPAPPEGPPSAADLARAAEGARRFVWGYLTGDQSVMEAESSFEFGRTLGSLSSPGVPAAGLALEAVTVASSTYADGRITCVLEAPSASGARRCTVVLAKGLGWEVVNVVPAP